MLEPLGLRVRPEIAAFVRALVPLQPQPAQRGHLCLDAALDVPLLVRVLDAQHELPAVMTRQQPVVEGGADVTEVRLAGGRGSVSGARGHADSVSGALSNRRPATSSRVRYNLCMRPRTSRRSITGGILLVLLALLAAGVSDGGPPAGAAVDLLPNLKALPARDLRVEQAGPTTKLRFSITSWNGGAGVLELRAGEINNQTGKQKVYQRVYVDDGSFREVLAGEFVWHQAHSHTHFEGYALYTLQPVGAPGGSNRIGNKTTFCIIDTDHVDASLPGSPGSPGYTTCGNSFQGLSVGWGDTYTWNLAGQEIDVTGLAAGDYFLTLDVDPNSRLEEGDETDNSSTILVRMNPAARTAVALPDGDGDGVTDTEDNCPQWANQDQSLPVWNVPAGDADCDGFPNAGEAFVGTDPAAHCANSSEPGDEPAPDAWPVDMDDSRHASTVDVGYFVPVLNEQAPGPPYTVRYDFNGDGRINTADIGTFVFFLNKTCTP